jgi:hypothetical protein
VYVVENSQDARKLKAQRDIEASSEQYISDCDWFRSHQDAKSIESVRWINTAVKTKSGRDLFTHELNQFRSKQVRLSYSRLFGTGVPADVHSFFLSVCPFL